MWSITGLQPKWAVMLTNHLGLGGMAANLCFRECHDKCVHMLNSLLENSLIFTPDSSH